MNGYPNPDKREQDRRQREADLTRNEARRVAQEKGSYGYGYAPEPVNPQPKTTVKDEHPSV